MAYIVIESSVRTHWKFLAAGPAASWLWACGLAYCQDGLTDGFIPRGAIKYLGVKNAINLVPKLVKATLWEELADGSGWHMHDYLDHNKSAEEVRKLMKKRAIWGRLGGRPRKGAEGAEHNLEGFTSRNLEGFEDPKPSEKPSSRNLDNLPRNPLRYGTTGTKDQDPRAAARPAFFTESLRRHLKRAIHAELDRHPDAWDSTLADIAKDLAAAEGVPYNGREVTKLIDAVRVTRARRSA